jgi:hypothetical protein
MVALSAARVLRLHPQHFLLEELVFRMKNRRTFLGTAVSSLAALKALGAQASAPQASVGDEAAFVKWYDVDRGITNLENAYWSIMSRPVMEEYGHKVAYINRRNVPFALGVLPHESLRAELLKVRTRSRSPVAEPNPYRI